MSNRTGRIGAPLEKTPATPAKARERDRLVREHGSLYEAAIFGGLREATLRRWLYTNPSRIDMKTQAGLKKLGVSA